MRELGMEKIAIGENFLRAEDGKKLQRENSAGGNKSKNVKIGGARFKINENPF